MKIIERATKGIEIVLQFAATTSGSNVILNKPYVHVTDNAVMNSYLLKSIFTIELNILFLLAVQLCTLTVK